MSWGLFKRFRLGGGVNANVSAQGIGWSWGLPGIRVGISASGRRWISFGIPGTGLYFYKTLGYPMRHRRKVSESIDGEARSRNDEETGSGIEKPPVQWKDIK